MGRGFKSVIKKVETVKYTCLCKNISGTPKYFSCFALTTQPFRVMKLIPEETAIIATVEKKVRKHYL